MILERNAPRDDIGHVHVEGGETSTFKCGSHFHLTVHALLAQNGNPRTHAAADERGGYVVSRIERKPDVQTWIRGIENAVVFLPSALRMIAQPLHVIGRL